MKSKTKVAPKTKRKQRAPVRSKSTSSFQKLRTTPHFSLKVALIVVLLFGGIGAYLLFSTRAATVDFKGYYIMVSQNYDRNEVKSDTKDPMVAGISARLYWKDLEPMPGQYNFSKIDNNLIPDANGKALMLRVMVGKSTTQDGSGVGVASTSADDDLPAWLFTAHRGRPAAEYFSFSKNSSGFDFIPYFWDATYQQDWADFVGALGAHYKSNPNMILQVTGPWKIHGEPYIPSCSGTDETNWVAAYKKAFNLTKANINDVSAAYDEFVTGADSSPSYQSSNGFSLLSTFSNNFPNQPMAMAGGLMFCDNVNTKPTLDPARHPENKLQFETARTRYGGYANGGGSTKRGFFVQYNGLSQNLPGPSDGMTQWVSANFNPIDGTVNRGVLGYQMIGGATDFGGGGPEISTDDYAASIDNATKLHASYIEVHQPVIAAALRADSQPNADLKNKANVLKEALSRNFPKLISTKSSTETPPPPADTTPPSVSVTAPQNGQTVSGNNVSITASANDDVGVARITFRLDGKDLSSDVAAPYSANWDTSQTNNGQHSLTAVATDLSNNVTTSTTVVINVNNQTTPPPPPPVAVPDVPTEVQVVPRNFITTVAMNLQWKRSTNASSYRVYRNGSLLSNTVFDNSNQNVMKATDPNPQTFTGYNYTVTAVNTEGKESAQSTSDYGRCDWFIWWFCK